MQDLNQIQIIEKTALWVKEVLKGAEGGHDWFHIERVWKNTCLIAQKEPVNVYVAQLAALLHDIADSKFYNGDETIGPQRANTWLQQNHVETTVVEQVVAIIENISFKGGKETAVFSSPELAVVQDADRLDAIGAIGIARAFNYGGFKNRPLYNPAILPDLNMNKEAYKNSAAPTINHFYEKLLLLKQRMNTKTGKQLAEQRHAFMENFLTQFYKEWNGEV
jgi:uncharacterized protein